MIGALYLLVETFDPGSITLVPETPEPPRPTAPEPPPASVDAAELQSQLVEAGLANLERLEKKRRSAVSPDQYAQSLGGRSSQSSRDAEIVQEIAQERARLIKEIEKRDLLVADRKRRDEARKVSAEGRDTSKMRGDDIRKRLYNVQARFNTPARLAYGQSVTINFVLETQGRGSAASTFEKSDGDVVTADVLVGAEAQALLTGPPDLVDIKFRGPAEFQRKTVSSIAPVQWTWDIRGIGIGTAVLQLELNAFVDSGKTIPPLQVRTFQQSIPIDISLTDRIVRFMTELNPIWASGATVITAIGGLLAYFGFKPGRRGPDAESKGKDTSSDVRRTSIYGKGRSRRS